MESVCPRYGAKGCGPECSQATAEVFAAYQYNQPEFPTFCPLVARYGEHLMREALPTRLIQQVSIGSSSMSPFG